MKGRLKMLTPTGEEEYSAGQAYYWGPGHVPVAVEDCEFVEFSPTGDFRKVIDHVTSQAALPGLGGGDAVAARAGAWAERWERYRI